MKGKFIALSVLAMALNACNPLNFSDNGTDTTAAKAQFAALSVLITDRIPFANYREIWISVRKLEAIDAQGNVVVLFDKPTGNVFNLASLQGVGALINAVNVPPGNYSNFRITLGRDVTVVDSNGISRNKQLAGTGATLTIDVAGALSAIAGNIASLILDFDVTQFTENAQGEWIPRVQQMQSGAESLVHTFGNVNGTVVAVNNDGTLDLKLDNDGAIVKVDVKNASHATDDVLHAALDDSKDIIVGDKLEVQGEVKLDDLTIDASSVGVGSNIETHDNSEDSNAEIKAHIVSLAGTKLTYDVIQAEHFTPVSTTGNQVDIAGAWFKRGEESCLLAGTTVELRGTVDASTNILTVTVISIEHGCSGANSTATDDTNNEDKEQKDS